MGLNDMKGRVEDAVTGRFLSPDPFVTDASNTQDFNRYSYVRSNPLVAAATVIGLVAALTLCSCRSPCQRSESSLATSSEDKSVVYVFEACTTIGTTTQARVVLASGPGRRNTIFRFAPADGYVRYHGVQVKGPLQPSATWTSAHSLKISIGTVAAILEQRYEVDGVQVTYDVGNNLHVESDSPK
jgi:hypothetical protein